MFNDFQPNPLSWFTITESILWDPKILAGEGQLREPKGHSKSEPGTINIENDPVHAGPSSAKQNLKDRISDILKINCIEDIMPLNIDLIHQIVYVDMIVNLWNI